MSEAKWRQQQPPHSPKFLRKEKEKPLPKKGISKYFSESVSLPPGEDLNEWLSLKTIQLFNEINTLVQWIQNECTPSKCPKMNAGPKFEYFWADGVKIIKPIAVSAPEYINYLMTWVQELIDDENIFPSQAGKAFPSNFKGILKNIFKRLFRIYAHVYYQHFQFIQASNLLPSLNNYFKRFSRFVNEFQLMEKNDLAPLTDLILMLMRENETT